MISKAMKKVIGYIRVSTNHQDLERQKVLIKKYCEENGFTLIRLIEDFGISGADRERAGYLELQAKRWANVVEEPVIQQFAGALDGKRASKGVFITTSTYSKDAKKYVDSLSKKIVLIDGKELASLMIVLLSELILIILMKESKL